MGTSLRTPDGMKTMGLWRVSEMGLKKNHRCLRFFSWIFPLLKTFSRGLNQMEEQVQSFWRTSDFGWNKRKPPTKRSAHEPKRPADVHTPPQKGYVRLIKWVGNRYEEGKLPPYLQVEAMEHEGGSGKLRVTLKRVATENQTRVGFALSQKDHPPIMGGADSGLRDASQKDAFGEALRRCCEAP